MCASCTVIKKTGLGMIRSDTVNINLSNFNVEDVEDAKTCLISMKSVSELRKLLIFLPNQLKLDILASRTAVGKDQGWSIMQMSYLVNDWKY